METRACTKCKKELPLTSEYFSRDKNTSSGFTSACKVCRGDATKYGNTSNFKWTEEIEEYLIELYFNHTYEWIINNVEEFKRFKKKNLMDKMSILRKRYPERDLYKNESSKDLEYRNWTKEQVDLLVELYPRKTNNELQAMNIFKDFTKEQISNKIKYLNNKYNISLKKNEDTFSRASYEAGAKIKGIPREFTEQHRLNMSKSRKGIWKGEKNPKFGSKRVGALNPNWKGGTTPLYWELRTQIEDWKMESMKFHDYKCIITKKNFDVIHHLYSFRQIVDEVFLELNLDIRQNVKNYTKEEFEVIVSKLKELHFKYGLGVCLTTEIHKDFHDKYGYKEFTKDNFIEYCKIYHDVDFTQGE